MPSTTSLKLRNNVTCGQIRLAVARLLGSESCAVVGLGLEGDPGKPSGPGNAWHFTIKGMRNLAFSLPDETAHDLSHFLFDVWEDTLPHGHQRWNLHKEIEVVGAQAFTAYTNAVVVAVGEGMARFFGGTLCRDDMSDKPPLRVPPSRAIFPPLAGGQPGSEERWFHFHNALARLGPLTGADIRRAMEAIGTASPEAMACADKLEAKAQARALEKILPAGREQARRNRM